MSETEGSGNPRSRRRRVRRRPNMGGHDPHAHSTGLLLPQHAALLRASSVSPEVANARGYRSLTTKADAERLGFGRAQRNVPALLLPVWNVAGEVATHQLRPDEPRWADGKPIRYETPSRSRMALDVPPPARPWIGDPTRPLFITEGIRKADAAVSRDLCCIALLGVWNWRGTNPEGGSTALPDWESIALNGREVYLAFDSDVMTKPAVYAALARLSAFLASRGARVRVVYLPPGAGGTKVGLDDFFATGGSVADLLALAADELRPPPGGAAVEEGPFAVRDGQLCYRKRERDGDVWLPMCNFSARIIEEVIADDGATERGEFVIAGALADGTPLPSVRVAPSRFASLDWVVARWGARAVVAAGIGNKDRLREAIQRLSADATRRREYTHPGWRRLDDHGWCYLHAGGAIGTAGTVADVAVNLTGSAARLRLPDPPEGDALGAAIHASLAVLDVAPPAITIPLLGMGYRAVLNELAYADLAGFLVGPTGVQKSELAALLMQHFGADFDRLHLPAGWASTANALERLAFDFKDAPVVIDDFAPTGSTHDIARAHATADRVLRGAGNAVGRGRMNADGTPRAEYVPRGLVIGTGEDVPRGQSARARAVIVELSPGDVDLARLTASQEAGRRGDFAAAMAGYLRWLVPQLDTLRDHVPDQLAMLRAASRSDGAHARTPEAVANLALGWQLWLRFAREAGALTEAEATAMWERVWTALGAAAAGQRDHQGGEAPARRFLDLLASALASGRAHVAGPTGEEPSGPEAWGWRERTIGTGDYQRDEWQSQGERIGWLAGDDLYLDPHAAFAAAQRLGETTGSTIGVGPKTLAKRLHEGGALRSTDQEDGNLQVRRTLEGTRRRVLHLAAGYLTPDESGQPGQPSQTGADNPAATTTPATPGRVPWSDSAADCTESGQENGPELPSDGTAGQNGQLGLVSPEKADGRAVTRCVGCGEALPTGRRYQCAACAVAGDGRRTA